MKQTIKKITAEEIFDSRGNPTLRVKMYTEDFYTYADVPSGASTGKFEALELRDEGERLGGKGVLNAVNNVNTKISEMLSGKNPLDQGSIDKAMIDADGTENKSFLGGNAMTGVSLANMRLASKISGKPLFEHLKNVYPDIKPSRKIPYLQANLINGGKHANTDLPFQEYHVIPDTENIEEALSAIFKIQNELKKELRANIGDEGGFVPQIKDPEEPLRIMANVIEKAGLSDKIKFSLDVAASSFYEKDLYNLGNEKICADELLEFYKNICRKYKFISIEDPFEESSFLMFSKMKKEISGVKIVGDDLTVTNVLKLKEAIKTKSIDAIIIKPNQIGTLSETMNTMRVARENNIDCIVSHRSGETNDDFIADLAFATGAFGVKFGALQRGERIAKYNRLKEIAQKND